MKRWPIPRREIENISWVCGVTALCLVGLGLYEAGRLLTHLLDREWSNLILLVPSFFAVLVIEPVQWRVNWYLTVWYCHTHGGHTYIPNAHATSLHKCARCGAIDMEHWRKSRLS